jgi:hypothetical protein
VGRSYARNNCAAPGRDFARTPLHDSAIELGFGELVNHACRHDAVLEVSSYPAETEVPSFRPRMKCGKCGKCGSKNVDVRPNWKEQPPQASVTGRDGYEPDLLPIRLN